MTDDFIMSPKNDWCFKELMKNEEVRKGFIAAILGRNPSEIAHTELLPTILEKEHRDDKWGVLDVHVRLSDGTEMDMEMQVAFQDDWDKRTIYYIGKMYTGQLSEGEDYDKLKKCVHVGILDFELFPEDKDFYSRFHFREDNRNILYSDVLEMHVIELPKLKKYIQEESELLNWAKFFNANTKEDFEMVVTKDEYLSMAYDNLVEFSADEMKRREYEWHRMATIEKNSQLSSAKRQGHKEGREEGLKEGIGIGQVEGIEITQVRIAKNMLQDGDSYEKISRNTGLTLDEIKKIGDDMKNKK